MLDCKRDRVDYGEQLQPPAGYELDRAVAATYSADLGTLLSIPVALVYAQTLEGDLTGARFQLLEAIKRFSTRVRVYHQKGQLHVPSKLNWLYAHLEDVLAPLLPDDAFAAFHPKIWIIKYTPNSSAEGGDSTEIQKNRFRVLVLSRNLTFDRSWDVAASLEGEVGGRIVSENRPLIDFVRWLHEQRPIDWVEEFLAELERARFATPHAFDNHAFHPIGFGSHLNSPVDSIKAKDTVVLSPFLDEATIRDLRARTERDFSLFSEPHELGKLPPELLQKISSFHLSELIVDGESLEASDDSIDDVQQQKLHAKTFVVRTPTDTRWFLGSANATKAARSKNVEFLIELRGASNAIRVNRLLRDLTGQSPGDGPFVPFEGEGGKPNRDSENQTQMRKFEHALLKADIEGEVVSSKNKKNFDLHLQLDLRNVPTNAGVRVTVQPFNVKSSPQPYALKIGGIQSCVFENIGEVELSKFLLFRITSAKDETQHQFLLRIEITGLPDDRLNNILRKIIDSQNKFFEYLRFLIADQITKEDLLGAGEDAEQLNALDSDAESEWSLDLPIYEQLLVVASRNPRKLAEVDDLVSQLKAHGASNADEATATVIPDAFLSFWEPFRELIPPAREP